MTSAEPVPITVGPFVGGQPMRLTWDPETAERLAAGDPEGPGRSAWALDGALDWEQAEALRLVWAVFDDGRALAVAALRPRGAPGHDRDSIGAHLSDASGEVDLTEALLSTEYDSEGRPRRIGVELWPEADSPPLRVAADREGDVEVGGDGAHRELCRMSFRLEGSGGAGAYELLRQA